MSQRAEFAPWKLITEELNTTPVAMPGDRRPLTDHLAEAQSQR